MQEMIECEVRLSVSLLIFTLLSLIGAGLVAIVFEALPYLRNAVHTQIVSYPSFLAERVPAWLVLKMETLDMFAALNPINVSVHTGALDTEKIRSIQLTFDGASAYFPGDYNFSDPGFSSNNSTDFKNQ